jgi:hypothetical protein
MIAPIEALAEVKRLGVTQDYGMKSDVAIAELVDCLASRANSADEAHAVISAWTERNQRCATVADLIDTLVEIRAGQSSLPKYGSCMKCGGVGFIVWTDARNYSHGMRCPACYKPPEPAAGKKAKK